MASTKVPLNHPSLPRGSTAGDPTPLVSKLLLCELTMSNLLRAKEPQMMGMYCLVTAPK